MPFPHENSENADLLGVLWADVDSREVTCDCNSSCYTCGTDVVYYKIYKFPSDISNISDPIMTQVYEKAVDDGACVYEFGQPGWVMVVTWSQVVPYPYRANKYSYEVIVITHIA